MLTIYDFQYISVLKVSLVYREEQYRKVFFNQ